MNKIPKVIHYIWLGGEIPLKIQAIIDKNSQYFKDYEVKIWTEESMPPLNEFAQQAYNEKKWAFVSDYLRFCLLYKEGGIYLDTDMDVLKSLDDLLEHYFFSGWGRGNEYIYAGIIGSVKEHAYLKKVIDYYDEIKSGDYPTSPEAMTLIYNSYMEKEELKIFGSEYFYPLLDGETPSAEKLKVAYTNHLWFESWRSFVPLRRILRRIGIINIYHWFVRNKFF